MKRSSVHPNPFKRLICMVLMLSLLSFALVPIQADAVKVSCTEYSGSNQLSDKHARYGSTIKSHLINVDGGLIRFQADALETGYLVEYYDSDFNFLSTVTVPTELPLYGGFYASGSNYYILSGQENPEESADVECFRVTKYDLNWNRLGSAGLYDCNTTIPFDAGSARFAMSGKYLVIRTAHEMYMSSDGYNHQSNVTIEVDTEAMTITDSYCIVMTSGYGYVSHSFNQFVHIEDNKIIAVDHGDAYPRSIVLLQYNTDMSNGTFTPTYYTRCTTTNLLTFTGGTGDNYTGASIGGFEISNSSYLVAYNYVANVDNYASNTATRNVFIASMNKVSGEVTLKQITSYADGDTTANVPHLVKLSDSSFLLLWEQGSTVYYTKLDAAGNPVGETYSMINSALSDCVPVVSNGKAIWYVWNDNLVKIYEINLNDLSVTSSVDLEYGHCMTVQSYPETAGGDCTLVCEDCDYSKTGATPTELILRWKDATTGNYYYSRPQNYNFDVGEKLYLWNRTTADDAELAQCSVTVSDPDGVDITWSADNMCCFTFHTPGTYTITVTCVYNPLLTQSYTFTVAHTYEDGTCTGCGNVFINPNSATLSLEGEVYYNIYFTMDDASSVKELGLITFNTEPTEGTIDNADCVLPGAEYNSTTNQYTAHTMGVPAKKLGDDLYIRIYAQMEDGSYIYSRMFSYSAKTYAYKKLSSTATDPDLKNLVIAMLNYGAEAQLALNYKTDALVNADLTAEQKASIATYTSDMMASRTLADSVKAGNFANSGQFDYRSASMILDGALAINYRFIPTNTPDSGVTLYYWDTATYNQVDVMTKDNATGHIDMVLDEGYYTAAYEGLAAKELDETIYVVAVYTSGEEEYTTEVIAYSLATYCNSASSKGTVYKALGEATVVYSYYAKIYFQNK